MSRLHLSSNITKVMLVYFCTRFHLYIHAYALILQQRGLTLLEISTIESIVIATVFLAEVPTGVLADRLGRKWSVTVSTLLLMLGELIFLFSTQYTHYLALAVFTGLGFAFSSGATESLIYDSLPPDNRDQRMKQIMGRYGSIGQIAFFLSPIIGGVIVGSLTPDRVQTAIGLTVFMLFIGVLISLALREPATEWHADRPSALHIFREGVGEIRHSRKLRRIALLAIFTMPFGGALVTTLAPPYLAQNGVPIFWVGLALAFGSLLAAVLQPNAYRLERWLGERKAITLLTLLPGAMYGVLAAAAGSVPVWLVVTTMYGTNDLKAPLFSAYQNALISSRSRATVLSLMNMILNLFVAVMAPVYAALATRSMPLAFVVIGSVILAAGVLLRVDRLPLVVGKPTEPL